MNIMPNIKKVIISYLLIALLPVSVEGAVTVTDISRESNMTVDITMPMANGFAFNVKDNTAGNFNSSAIAADTVGNNSLTYDSDVSINGSTSFDTSVDGMLASAMINISHSLRSRRSDFPGVVFRPELMFTGGGSSTITFTLSSSLSYVLSGSYTPFHSSPDSVPVARTVVFEDSMGILHAPTYGGTTATAGFNFSGTLGPGTYTLKSNLEWGNAGRNEAAQANVGTTLALTAVPEPSSVSFLGLGVLSLILRSRRS